MRDRTLVLTMPPLVAVVLAISFRSLIAALSMAFLTGALLHFGSNPTVFVPGAVNDFLLANILRAVLALYFRLSLTWLGWCTCSTRAVASRDWSASSVGWPARTLGKSGHLGLGADDLFDDYSNTIVVGQTMRSLTDRYRISREKLAYLVDSTTAPIAGLAIVSSWIAYEVWLLARRLNRWAWKPVATPSSCKCCPCASTVGAP